MSAYRFCRTDDIGLLVDALNRCWHPYVPGEPPVSAATFKRAIRDLQVWCSSCMVAFAGAEPIAVLIGAKRPSATLIHRIAVHPAHVRQGHGRHLLESLSSKLAILGPPRIVAEVPEALTECASLFRATGYVQEAVLTDYVLPGEEAGLDLRQRGLAAGIEGMLIPVTVDDLEANGLLGAGPPQSGWERSAESLVARKDEIAGVAVASEERIEAYLLYIEAAGTILSLRGPVDDGGATLARLLSGLRGPGARTLRWPKVAPAELPPDILDSLGFRPTGRHLLYATSARSA